MTQATKRVPAENIEHGIQRTRWLLTCAALLAFVLCGTAAAHAQSSRSLSGAMPPATANRSAASPGPRTAEQSPASGMNTGIKVHGHWTIDVLNPDGTLVKHVEFENALTLVGAETLPLILGRAATPGAWAIGLGYGAVGPAPDRGDATSKRRLPSPRMARTTVFRRLLVGHFTTSRGPATSPRTSLWRFACRLSGRLWVGLLLSEPQCVCRHRSDERCALYRPL